MATATRTKEWASGDVLTAADLGAEFDNLLDALAIVNADISASAAIAASKISGTAMTLASTDTITGVKTFNIQAVFNKATKQSLETDTDGATITFDLDEANIHTVTLGGNRTLAISNEDAGQAFVIRLAQDGTGSRTVTWFSTIKWAGGSAPTLTTTASKADVFGFICTSSGNYDGYVIGQNI